MPQQLELPQVEAWHWSQAEHWSQMSSQVDAAQSSQLPVPQMFAPWHVVQIVFA